MESSHNAEPCSSAWIVLPWISLALLTVLIIPNFEFFQFAIFATFKKQDLRLQELLSEDRISPCIFPMLKKFWDPFCRSQHFLHTVHISARHYLPSRISSMFLARESFYCCLVQLVLVFFWNLLEIFLACSAFRSMSKVYLQHRCTWTFFAEKSCCSAKCIGEKHLTHSSDIRNLFSAFGGLQQCLALPRWEYHQALRRQKWILPLRLCKDYVFLLRLLPAQV